MLIKYLDTRRKLLLSGLVIMIAFLMPLSVTTVHAQDDAPAPTTCTGGSGDSENCVPRLKPSETYGTSCGDIKNASEDCEIIKMANSVIRFLSAIIGVVVTIMIIVGGIQYATAGGDPNKVAGAKNVIRNAIIAIIAYVFLFAFLDWVVPGGIV